MTYTYKCYLLFGALALFFVIGYNTAFADTFTIAGEITAKEKKLQWLRDKEKELPALKIKMAEFEKAYSACDSGSVRDKLTACISDFAEKNNCLVTEIPLNTSFKNNDLKVQTNSFTVKGGFNNLLKLLYTLENNYRYVSKIMSVRFFTVRDIQSKQNNLYLTLVTQSFEQKK